MLPDGKPAASSLHYTTSCNTQSSVPEDGRNYRPKHVELIGIMNKPLILHLVGCASEDGRNYRPKHVELIGIINKLLLLYYFVVYIIVGEVTSHIGRYKLFCQCY